MKLLNHVRKWRHGTILLFASGMSNSSLARGCLSYLEHKTKIAAKKYFKIKLWDKLLCTKVFWSKSISKERHVCSYAPLPIS